MTQEELDRLDRCAEQAATWRQLCWSAQQEIDDLNRRIDRMSKDLQRATAELAQARMAQHTRESDFVW